MRLEEREKKKIYIVFRSLTKNEKVLRLVFLEVVFFFFFSLLLMSFTVCRHREKKCFLH
jgi:hypothetical protein